MAQTLLHGDEDCADAIQEAIMKAYRSIPKLREPAYFRTWMFRILIHESRRIYHNKQEDAPDGRSSRPRGSDRGDGS
ncbi:hypothetical protein J4772_07100 [Cohnella sp. LGH]|uniref:sigma factor n=1 Tax=Cohnella sp. LGH TaxID=1619153 RepID=UPI001ADC3833|nr:sigma factor [Cohnella sp. LGH]QTH44154.1 hypothetical protein J4772_07100 [Cohnella sp. LGH]